MEEEDREPEEKGADIIHLVALEDGVRLTAQAKCDDPEMQAKMNALLGKLLHEEPPDDG